MKTNLGHTVIGSKNGRPLPSKEELNEVQQLLLGIAEDQIVREKNINLYPLELLEIAKKKVEMPETDLFQNITELYRKKWIIPGEGKLKDQVLDSLLHRKIYYYILKNPGCDTSDIMKKLNISFRYALKNLETLFIFGFIRARKYSQFFLYFPYNMPEAEDMLYCLARNRMIRKVLKFLAGQKLPVDAFEIAQALGKKEITIQRTLIRLIQQQVVSLVRVGLRQKYKVNKLDIDVFRDILKRYKEF